MKKLFLYNLPSIGNLYVKTVYKEDDFGPIDFICETKSKREYFLHRRYEGPNWLMVEPTCISEKDFKQNTISFKDACERARRAYLIWFDGRGFHKKEVHTHHPNQSLDPFRFNANRYW